MTNIVVRKPAAIDLRPKAPRLVTRLKQRFFTLPADIRSMSIDLVAGKGAGKSRLLGRAIAWQDCYTGVPLVILDPHGQTLDNLLDKLLRLPEGKREEMAQRILYVDMAGASGYVFPWPLYYRRGSESLFDIASRFVAVIRRLDPALESASIEGYNALYRVAIPLGMVLAALGWQITEAAEFLGNPQFRAAALRQALNLTPEVAPAVEFFRSEYPEWSQARGGANLTSLRTKLAPFSLDPHMRAMFGGTGGINWQEVVDEKLTVLLDFRHEVNFEHKRLKLLWVYQHFMEYVLSRGAGRHTPISLIIDELTYLLDFSTQGVNLLEKDLNELINRVARNCSLWVTLCRQEEWQVSEFTQKTLATCGTHIYGVTTDAEGAEARARRHVRFDPYKLKERERVWMSGGMRNSPFVVDYKNIYFTAEEQHLLNSYRFMDLPTFHFLVSLPKKEGSPSHTLYPISLEQHDLGLFVDEARVAACRRFLSQRCGRPQEAILTEIANRVKTPSTLLQTEKKPGRVSLRDGQPTLVSADGRPPKEG
jgi:hypothetical protein